jgi:hypothetical protein
LDSPKNPPQYKQISLKSSGKVLAQSNDWIWSYAQ